MAKVSIKININIRNVAGLRLCMIVILMCYRINFLKRCNFIIANLFLFVSRSRWVTGRFGSRSRITSSFVFKEYLKMQQESCNSNRRGQPNYAADMRRLWTANTCLKIRFLGKTILWMKILCFPHNLMFNSLVRTYLTNAYPVLNGKLQPIHQHVFESNLQNSIIHSKR